MTILRTFSNICTESFGKHLITINSDCNTNKLFFQSKESTKLCFKAKSVAALQGDLSPKFFFVYQPIQ